MSAAEYLVYLDGRELTALTDITVNWEHNAPAKWTISGKDTGCPLKSGDRVKVYRNGAPYCFGFVTQIREEHDGATGICSWTADGNSDLARISDRVIYPDPTSNTLTAPESYVINGQLSGLVRRAISEHGAGQAMSERRIPGLVLGDDPYTGDDSAIDSLFDNLFETLQEMIPDSLKLREVWDESETWRLELAPVDDKSERVIFSTDLGTIANWKREITRPTANVIICKGYTRDPLDPDENGGEEDESGDNSRTRYCMVEDSESIATWGRIEQLVERGDITPLWTDGVEYYPEQNEDETLTEETEEHYLGRLEEAAREELLSAEGAHSYEAEIIPLDSMAYGAHWDIGDRVSLWLDGERIVAQITQLEVSFKAGIETIKPTVGKTVRGELGSLFDALDRVKKQVRTIERQ